MYVIYVYNVCVYKYLPIYNAVLLSHKMKEILYLQQCEILLWNSFCRWPEHRFAILRTLWELNYVKWDIAPYQHEGLAPGHKRRRPVAPACREGRALSATRLDDEAALNFSGSRPSKSPTLACGWSDLNSCTFSRRSWNLAQWTRSCELGCGLSWTSLHNPTHLHGCAFLKSKRH